ncbi:P-loop NTPase fold protein [uncultured Shewanella sp.]|uniref:KAP family P-loop NTPase fold protein n=1 Tax=uncultured Shewanella sp. TaxID=173975 RepID=UPI00262ED5D7|nr:P-loop NTPase fold protein [uncultured Shewanella sp.]
MINKNNAVYNDWFDDFDWKDPNKCYLKREEYGKYLSSYIRNQKNGLVLNLNGEWGTGKTFFIKQLYTNLLKTHEKPTVYINAWKSDFSNDPLLVIIAELLEQMSALFSSDDEQKKAKNESKTKEIFSKLGSLSKKVYNGGLDVAAAYVSSKNEKWETGLDATALVTIASHLKVTDGNKLQVDEPRFGRSLSDNYKKQIKAIEDTKSLMSAYAELICGTDKSKEADTNKKQGKIYVLVDELDRCRPSYAIELLETIKHFFDIPNFVFVVATDTTQLSHSIKAVYGNDFNGQEYLTRFFNRTATVPQGNLKGFVKALIKETCIIESFEKGIMFPGKDSDAYPCQSNEDFIVKEITHIAVMYDIKLRKLEQFIAKFESIVVEAYEIPNVIFDFRMLLQLLAEYSTDGFYECYLLRKQDKSDTFNPAPKTVEKLGWDRYQTDLIGHLLRGKNLEYKLPVDKYNDSQQVSYLREKYNASWLFLANCAGPDINFLKVGGLFSSMKRPRNDTLMYYKYNTYQRYAKLTQDMHNSLTHSSTKYNVFPKEMYFKKVEIADSLT